MTTEFGGSAAAEESDAFEEVTGGHAGGREHDLARDQLLERVLDAKVSEPGREAGLPLIGRQRRQPGLHVAAGRSAAPPRPVHPACRRRSPSECRRPTPAAWWLTPPERSPAPSRLDARAGRPHLTDELLVTRSFEQHHREILAYTPLASANAFRLSVGDRPDRSRHVRRDRRRSSPCTYWDNGRRRLAPRSR